MLKAPIAAGVEVFVFGYSLRIYLVESVVSAAIDAKFSGDAHWLSEQNWYDLEPHMVMPALVSA